MKNSDLTQKPFKSEMGSRVEKGAVAVASRWLSGLLSRARLNPMRGYYLWGKIRLPPRRLYSWWAWVPIHRWGMRGKLGGGRVSEGVDPLARVRALGISRWEMKRKPGRIALLNRGSTSLPQSLPAPSSNS